MATRAIWASVCHDLLLAENDLKVCVMAIRAIWPPVKCGHLCNMGICLPPSQSEGGFSRAVNGIVRRHVCGNVYRHVYRHACRTLLRIQEQSDGNGHSYIGHNCIGHKYTDHNYTGLNYMGHNYTGLSYMGHNYMGHNYLGRNYIGHNYMGHNYTFAITT